MFAQTIARNAWGVNINLLKIVFDYVVAVKGNVLSINHLRKVKLHRFWYKGQFLFGKREEFKVPCFYFSPYPCL